MKWLCDVSTIVNVIVYMDGVVQEVNARGCDCFWRDLWWSIISLRSVSCAVAQSLGIMSKCWQVFHDLSLLRTFWCFVLPVLEYCSGAWCSAADSHLKLLDRVVRSVTFLAGAVLDCNLAIDNLYRCCACYFRSSVSQCILCLSSSQWPSATFCLTCWRVLLMAHWFLIGYRLRLLAVELLITALPSCPSQYLCRTILVNLCLMVWDWRDLKQCHAHVLEKSALSFCLLLFSHFLLYVGPLWKVGVFGLIECFHSLPALHCGLIIMRSAKRMKTNVREMTYLRSFVLMSQME